MNSSGKAARRWEVNAVWSLLKSMKFAVWILVILAAASLISMFIVEFFPIDGNISNWKEVYREKYDPLFPVMLFLHLQDPYRSWWYQALLGVLTLSLMICLVDRTPAAVKRTFSRKFIYSHTAVQKYPESAVIKTDSAFLARLPLIFQGYSLKRQDKTGIVYLKADRGNLSYLGSPLIHCGLLLLVIGGLLAVWGVSTYGSGYPGDIIESEAFDFKIRVDDFRIEYYPLGIGQWVLVDSRNIGKIVKRLDSGRFIIEFFTREGNFADEADSSRIRNRYNIDTDRGNIKDYISDLTVIDGGVETVSTSIEVNKPLRYKGYRFYQSSFNTRSPKVEASLDSAVIEISQRSGGSLVDTLTVAFNESYPLPNGDSIRVSEFLPDFRLIEAGAVSVSENLHNPAVKVKVYQDGGVVRHQWCFTKSSFHKVSPDAEYTFRVLKLINPRASVQYATVLEIKENFGYEVIWAGLILATIGALLLFYISPRHLWAVASFDGDECLMSLGGYSAKTHHGFSSEFKKIVKRLESIPITSRNKLQRGQE